jgi:hypothetical protein
MRNTADVTGGKPMALLQSISGVSAINPLVAFYDIHRGKREVLFFYFVPDTTRDMFKTRLFETECWAMQKKNERKSHVAEMRMLRWMCGVIRMDKVRNKYIRGSLKIAPVTKKLKGNYLSWYGHVMRIEENHVTGRVMNIYLFI